MSLTAIEAVILAGIDQGQTLTQLGGQLSLSHSAVSKALQAAQSRERLRLVDHDGRRLRLTPAGKVLALRAREVVVQLAELNELLVNLQAGRGGPLHIVAARSPGNYVLPDIISEFGRVFPQAQVKLAVVSSRELWRVFAEQNYDLGVGPRPEDAPGWLVEPLYDDGPVFFVSSTSSLVAREVRWEDVADRTFIGPFSQPYWSLVWDSFVGPQHGVNRRIPLDDIEGVKELVATDAGVGCLFGSTIIKELADGRLVQIDLPGSQRQRQHFYLVHRDAVGQLPIVDQFRNFLIGRLQQSAERLPGQLRPPDKGRLPLNRGATGRIGPQLHG